MSKRGEEVKITQIQAMRPGNKTKCAAERPDDGLEEAEGVRGGGEAGTFWRVFFCGVSCFLSVLLASGAEAALGAAEQEQRALEIRLAIARLPEDQVKEREALYREIVKSCPKTEAAEEALWALSNLYLDAFPEPREQTAQEVLELLLARYPDSRWGLQVRSRLVLLYSGTERRRRAAELCRELLNQGPEGLPESCRPFLALTEAIAWDEAKETAKAREAYTQVIRLYPGTSRAGYAAKRLAAMDDEEKKAKRK